MANQIILKKSSVAAKVPLTTDLAYGELALNYQDGKLYYKTASNTIESFSAGSATTTPSASIVAGEALSAGNLINIYSDAGTFKVRKAEADVSGREAHGYVSSSASSGANATVYFAGTITGLTGLTPGIVYLSATPGAVTNTAPSTSGHTVQKVGVAVSATSIAFFLGEPVLLA